MTAFIAEREANNFIADTVRERAEAFGLLDRTNAIFRDSLDKDVPYLAIIRPEETESKYADFSYVIFTDTASGSGRRVPSRLLVTLCVGSLQFKNDASLAVSPWWRREFQTLMDDCGNCFIKSDFSNISEAPAAVPADAYEVLPAQSQYWKLIQAGVVVDLSDLEGGKRSKALQWLACYANLREWGGKGARDKRRPYLPSPKGADVEKEVAQLLDSYRYVVLQGAPGTGKTYTANRLAHKFERVVFTQFHAETTYTDFVGGIVPDTSANELRFKRVKGVLAQAVEAANSTQGKVLLVIDEINRANLPNVLGPVFYLFENHTGSRAPIALPDLGEIASLPSNLYVLATMNTADRSLAVVDFALRRRFVWYTLQPTALETTNFHAEQFAAMAQIFRRYASDAELNLQPGHSYFLTPSGDERAMAQRVRYELLPLIKEYLNEGYLAGSQEAFADYFRRYAQAALFE